MVKFYQLVVKGPLLNFSSEYTHHSKRIFKDRNLADKKMAAFIKTCLTPLNDEDLFVLEKVTSSKIIELEFMEE